MTPSVLHVFDVGHRVCCQSGMSLIGQAWFGDIWLECHIDSCVSVTSRAASDRCVLPKGRTQTHTSKQSLVSGHFPLSLSDGYRHNAGLFLPGPLWTPNHDHRLGSSSDHRSSATGAPLRVPLPACNHAKSPDGTGPRQPDRQRGLPS